MKNQDIKSHLSKIIEKEKSIILEQQNKLLECEKELDEIITILNNAEIEIKIQQGAFYCSYNGNELDGDWGIRVAKSRSKYIEERIKALIFNINTLKVNYEVHIKSELYKKLKIEKFRENLDSEISTLSKAGKEKSTIVKTKI